MTVNDVQDALAKIKDAKDDPEMAHMVEDALYVKVLRSIADGNCDDPIAVCREALKASKIKYPRYHA